MASGPNTVPGTANFFQGASDLSFYGPVNATAVVLHESFDPWSLLYAEVAPNAILNAGGRADPVRCHPGTREEVISKAETWMATGYLEDRRIFWLSGPAGAGKSAIVQTLAENCIQQKEPMANFFFFRGDGSRAHSRPVVATLLYQLFVFFPDLKAIINDLIRQDRLIFKQSLRDQLLKLVDGPIRELRGQSPNQRPIVLLIDGLDECDARQDLDAATRSEQITFLNVLHELVTRPDSAFIGLVASRVESHIHMAFNNIGCYKDSIYLNDDYKPSDDIRLFITAELHRIKGTHALGGFLDAAWPPEDIIEVIVNKSSGQFIYAATVARFIAGSSQSPALSLDMVLNVRPAKKYSPFAEIDAIYTIILSRCENWEAVREVLAVDHLYRKSFNSTPVMSALGYSKHEIISFFSDLTSVIQVSCDDNLDIVISFYHASLEDFMYDLGRAKQYHIHLVDSANTLSPRLILGISHYYTMLLAAVVLREVDQRSNLLTTALTHLPPTPSQVNIRRIQKYFYPQIKELYADDQTLCSQICDYLKQWAQPDHQDYGDLSELPGHPMPFDDPDADLESDYEQSDALSVSSLSGSSRSSRKRELEARPAEIEWKLRELRAQRAGEDDNALMRMAGARIEELEDELENAKRLLKDNTEELEIAKRLLEDNAEELDRLRAIIARRGGEDDESLLHW